MICCFTLSAYGFFRAPEKSYSSFPDYVKSIRKAADLAAEAGVKKVYCSHNLASVTTETLCSFADYLEAMEHGEVTDYESIGEFRCYVMDEYFSFVMLEDGAEPVGGYSVAVNSP